MPPQGVFTAIILPLLLWVCVTMAQDTTTTTTTTLTVPSTVPSKLNGTSVHQNSTNSSHGRSFLPGFSVDSSMIQRALYVLIGITVIGVLYFLVRAVRLKKPLQKKKYGLLSNMDDNVEMDGMDSDEDETVYEARSLRR